MEKIIKYMGKLDHQETSVTMNLYSKDRKEWIHTEDCKNPNLHESLIMMPCLQTNECNHPEKCTNYIVLQL